MEKAERFDNVDKLREVGLVIGELPPPYHAVVQGLTDHAIETLANVKRRLDAERDYARGQDPDAPDYVTFFVPL